MLYEERGVTILKDEYERFISSLFLRAIKASEYGYEVNFDVVKLSCEQEELNILEVFDILNCMCAKANKGK